MSLWYGRFLCSFVFMNVSGIWKFGRSWQSMVAIHLAFTSSIPTYQPSRIRPTLFAAQSASTPHSSRPYSNSTPQGLILCTHKY
ncbi:hypothetical protein BDR22DRAFT_852149 [Usnea florida]